MGASWTLLCAALGCATAIIAEIFCTSMYQRVRTTLLFPAWLGRETMDWCCHHDQQYIRLRLSTAFHNLDETTKTGEHVVTVSPEPTCLITYVEPPSIFGNVVLEALLGNSGDCHVQTSPRSLLLHVPPTDPPRRLFPLADSPQGDLGRPR